MAFSLFRNTLLGGAILAAAVATAAPASAGVVVDFGFVPLGGTLTYTPDGAISGASTISGLGSIPLYIGNTIGGDDTTGISIGSFPTLNWHDPITFTPGLQPLVPTVTETFTGTGGTYNVVFNTLFAQSVPGSTSLTWVLEGTLTPPASLGDPTQPIFLSTAFTNVSNSNAASTNVSFTETSSLPPVITTPEPASMAVLGMGLLGIGISRRRKG